MAAHHYDAMYFSWQKPIGQFGAWANLPIYAPFIEPDHVVMEFGCGGGYLLQALNCARRIGVEVNGAAQTAARANGVEVHKNIAELPDASVDVVISHHALEHVERPLDEMRAMCRVLKPRGKAVIVVPCEAISTAYRTSNIDHHLYTWSPMNLGNLMWDAGFLVHESKPYMRRWPPKSRLIAKIGGRPLFDFTSRIYAHLYRRMFQVRAVGIKR